MEDEEPQRDEVLAVLRVNDVHYDPERGTIDIPLSECRKIADWVRRHDLRPTKKPAKPWGRV